MTMRVNNKFGFYGQILLLAVLVALPFVITSSYLKHIMTLILVDRKSVV